MFQVERTQCANALRQESVEFNKNFKVAALPGEKDSFELFMNGGVAGSVEYLTCDGCAVYPFAAVLWPQVLD